MKATQQLLTKSEREDIAAMVISPTFKNLLRHVSAMADMKLLEKVEDEKLARGKGDDNNRFVSARQAGEDAAKYEAFVTVAGEMMKVAAADKDYFQLVITPTME